MRGALAVDMSAPRLAFWGAVRSYLRGGTVSSCQRRLDGVFLSGSVMCALCGLAAEVCKAPCAPATRARRFCAAGARPISGRRTRFEELSAATVVKFGSTAITSQRDIIGNGRSGAQSGCAFQGAVFKNRSQRHTSVVKKSLPNTPAGAQGFSGGLRKAPTRPTRASGTVRGTRGRKH